MGGAESTLSKDVWWTDRDKSFETVGFSFRSYSADKHHTFFGRKGEETKIDETYVKVAGMLPTVLGF